MYKAHAFINGVSVSSDQEIEIRSPIDGSVVGTIPSLREDQVLEAFKSAKQAFEKWKNVDYKTRVKFLLNFASTLRSHAQILSQIIHLETGKDFKDAHDEVMRSFDYIVESTHAYSDMVEKPEEYSYENNILVPKDLSATYLRVPHGVALTISPFNYPVNLMITKIVPAILAGNTVVHKSSTNGSISGWYVSKLLVDSSVDGYLITPGVLNYVTGKGSSIGNWFLKSPYLDVFSFTGSTDVGQDISRKLPPIPMQLEMGGNNPAIVLKDADIDLSVSQIIKGAFSFSGQRCTAIRKVFLSKDAEKEFLEKLELAISKMKKFTEPLISSSVIDTAKEFMEDALSKGASLFCSSFSFNGNILEPLIFKDVSREMKIFQEELFAPVLSIIPFSKQEELIELCNDSKYGLQASIFTKNIELASDIALNLDFGRINVNTAPSRSPDILPFSGVKESGLEVQGIKNSLFFFTRFKGVVLKKI